MDRLPSPSKPSSSSSLQFIQPKKPKRPPVLTGALTTTTTSTSTNLTPHSHTDSATSDPAGLDLSKLRAHAACKNCRVKKVKCLPGPSGGGNGGGADPSHIPGPCQQCIAGGTECIYPPTRDRAAYSRQYVQNLEARVQALEGAWGRMAPMLEMFEGGGGPSRLGGMANVGTGTGMGGSSGAGLERGSGIRNGNSIMELINPSNANVLDEEDEGPGDTSRMEDDLSSAPSVEDGGQITQDERGNYRWIGSSNTLSLLDSFTPHSHSQSHNHTHTKAYSNSPSHPHSHNDNQLGEGIPHRPQQDRNDSHTNPYFGPVAGSGVVKALPGIDEVSYPSHRAARDMVDAFFRDVHPMLPVVVEHEFRVDFDRLMQRRSMGEADLDSPTFVSVLFAVFALGERVIQTGAAWQREKVKVVRVEGEETVMPGEAEAGVIWYERAQILHYTTLKDVNIHQVQCLTLMAAFQASVNAMPMAWLLAGQAIRVAQDLGLHRSTARMTMSFQEKQLRARCWWAIYGLERMVSIAIGRPLGVDDLDIDVAYPAEVDDSVLLRITSEGRGDHTPPDLGEEPHESTMSGFVALTKLCKIAGRVAHVLYRPSNKSVNDPSWAVSQQNTINKLDKLLRDWLANDVPNKYKDPSTNRNVQLVSAVLSNSYFAVLITLHRNFLPANPDYPRPKPPPNSQSLSHCVDAARSVIHVAAQSRVLVPPSHHLAVFCQFLWSSAVILLLCEVQARDQVVVDAVESQVESCRRSLQALEPVWPGSRKLKELLNDVEGRTKEVVAQPEGSMRKRKSSPSKRHSTANHNNRQDLPSGSQPGSADPAHYNPAGKRVRIYETSDTRTNIPLEEYMQPPQAQAYSLNPMSVHTNTHPQFPNMDLNLATNHQSQQQQQQQFQPFDTTFDVGGVTFDGLEMLQGFTGIDPASIWGTLADGFIQTPTPTPGAGTGNGTAFQSAQGTPTSQSGSMSALPIGTGTGPSPTTGNGNLGTSWQYMPTGTGNTGTGLEMWNQVSGGMFDWGSDPNVPFNI